VRSRTALLSIALFLGFLLLYGSMSAPGLDWGDAAEAQLAAWTAGLSHPTGYPLFLMLGWLWTHALALVGVPPTRAMTLFSVTAGAATVAFMVPMMRAGLRRADPHLGEGWSLAVATAAALFFGLSRTFWSQALLAEVYTLHALLLVLLLWGLWSEEWGPRRLPWLALLYGVALSHHRSAVLWLPGLLLWVWLERRALFPPSGNPARQILGWVGLVALPQLAYLYVAWRGPVTPYLHQPLGDGQTLNLYDGSARAFLTHISGSVFASDLRLEQALAERLRMVYTLAQANGASLVTIYFAGLGLAALRWSDRLLLMGGVLATLLFGTLYAIGDVEVQFIPAWLGLTVLLGVGTAWFARILVEKASSLSQRRLMLALPVLVLAVLAVRQLTNAPPSRAALDEPRRLVSGILDANPPPNAILVTNDRDEMVPFWYAQFAEGQRRDVLGLLPLITPAPEHRTVSDVVGWALQWGRPVLLTKPMPGLALQYDLEPYAGPLVAVRGRAVVPDEPVAQSALAPELSVVGWEPPPAQVTAGETVTVSVGLQVNTPLNRDLSFSLQLFSEDGTGVTQQDVPPDPSFPSSAWPVGEPLRLGIPLTIPADIASATYEWRLSAYTLENGFTVFGQQVVLGRSTLGVQP
jgi:hypothetical protein